jgi:hypothetical protein
MAMKANFPILLVLTAFSGVALPVEAAPIKLVCKGPVTMAFDAEKVTDPVKVDVELDQSAGWVRFEGWAVDVERIAAKSLGDVMTFTHNAPGPGVVSSTRGRIDLATRRIYLDTTVSSSDGPGKQWTTDLGMRVTTLRVTGDVPCQTR